MMETIKKNRAILPFLFVVAYLLLAMTWQDIPLTDFDDAMYLNSGNHLHASMFLNDLTSMPLYALWFKALTYICVDPIWRQFLNWAILVSIAALLPLVFEIPLAWFYTVVLVALPVFRIGPYVSLFASIFFVVGLAILLRRNLSLTQSAALACAASFAVAYARPEYVYGVFLSALAVVIALILERKTHTTRSQLSALILTLALVCAATYVLTHSDTGRSGVAFAQHFNLKAAAKGSIPQAGEWDSTYAYDVFGIHRAANGGKHSIAEFFHANPRLFTRYVLSNIFAPVTMVFLAGLLLTILWPWFHPRKRSLRSASLFILLIAIPTILSLFLVYPERHYFSIVFPALLLFSIQLIGPRWANSISSARWIPIVGLAFMIAFSLYKAHPVASLSANSRPGIRAILCLRNLERTRASRTPVIFDPTGVLGIYSISPGNIIPPENFTDWSSFMQWVAQMHPDLILDTQDVEADYQVSHVQFDHFVEHDLGYTPHACPGMMDVIAYRSPIN